MALRDSILQVLEQNRDVYISGQMLADQLGVSRAGICKAIHTLISQGYRIDSVTNKGYRLSSENNILSTEGIRVFLCEQLYNCTIHVYDEIDSTNAECKRLALQGAEEFTIVVANSQTNGRGRLGRSFYSPSDTGIYISFILRPNLDLPSATLITTAISVAVCKAIEKITGLSPSIKWINDIYLNGKKICGILTEAISDFESGTVDSVICGIGVNVFTSDSQFPEELQSIAGSLFPVSGSALNRNQLAAQIVNEFYHFYKNLTSDSFMAEYRSRSAVLGKHIYYIKNGVKYYGTATDITQSGALVVIRDDGPTEILSSGEITLRLD